MARISGVDLPREKRVEIGLTYIYGIGLTTSQTLLARTGINPDTRVRDLTDDEVTRLRDIIDRELRVEEQLRFSARLHGLSRVASRRAVADTLARCGLEAVQRRLIGHLSRGYQQRVGIAQTLLHDPPLLLLDEPTTGLDPLQVAELHQLIRELGRDHGVIFSTHRLAEVRAVCTHVQIMRDGRLVYAGALAELERGDLTTALRVGFETSPPLTALAALPGVIAVEPLGRGRFRLRHAAGANLARMLVEQAVAAGWGLCELIPEGADLEQRCIELLLGTEEAS